MSINLKLGEKEMKSLWSDAQNTFRAEFPADVILSFFSFIFSRFFSTENKTSAGGEEH